MRLRAVYFGLLLTIIESLAAQQPATPAGGKTVPLSLTTVEQNLFGWLVELEKLPNDPLAYAKLEITAFLKAIDGIEQWAIEVTRVVDPTKPADLLLQQQHLVFAKTRLDRLLDRLLELRVKFAPARFADEAARSTALVNYLQATSQLTDLAGRVRYLQRDAFDLIIEPLLSRPAEFNQLVDRFIEYRSSSGAVVLLDYLFEFPTGEPTIPALTPAARARILDLVAAAGTVELLPDVVELLEAESQSAVVRWAAARAIMALGLPQQPRISGGATAESPVITPARFYELLQRLPLDGLNAAQQAERSELLRTIAKRMRSGIAGETFRHGRLELKAGDWLLMRNPSPYNHCTDLSPGLFTHVGVVAIETGTDGVRRFVLVDLPERGKSIPATNLEQYLQRTLNYAFLRHRDPTVAAKMGQAAADCIGNPSEFDLNFRTDRVLALAGKPLRGAKIHTYCAGFLLLCAQAAQRSRDEFFPLPETAAPGNIRRNFEQLGFSFGEGFVSPTGALFSPQMNLVGRRDPQYDPRREVEETVFDHFAHRCRTGTLVQSPDLLQGLRTKTAEAAKSNPLLAQALAATAGVSAEMDLVAAAKAAAVVETLDEIAFGRSREFLAARNAITAGPQPSTVPGLTADEIQQAAVLRARHADLAARWDARQLPPRLLRIELVKYYSAAGKYDLDKRFFPNEPQTMPAPPPLTANLATGPATNNATAVIPPVESIPQGTSSEKNPPPFRPFQRPFRPGRAPAP